jgi:hypothetical protein
LLLLDGHSSHYEPQSIELAKENDVIIFCLPPHTTQPLDTTVFGPLKHHWSEVCHNFLHNNLGKVVNKYNFTAQAWLKALTPTDIVAGFRKYGVHPMQHREALLAAYKVEQWRTLRHSPSQQRRQKILRHDTKKGTICTVMTGMLHGSW